MKTYKNLYTQIISLENIHKAIDKAARGKKHRKAVQKVLQNRHYYAKSVQERLKGQKPLLEPTTRKIKSENGKDRELDYPACKGVKVLRYADDIVAFSNSKRALWQHFHTLQAKTQALGLELHKIKLKPITQGLDFLGIKLYADFTLLRARNARKIKALARIKRVGAKEFARIFSFYGFYQRACCFNLFSKVFRELKPKIKAYCKKSRIAYPLKGLCFYRRSPRLFHF